MGIFRFYQDIQVRMWQRQFFDIEAETEEEAKKIAMQFVDKDVSNSEYFDYFNDLYDTEEQIHPEEVDGRSTIQLYVDGANVPFAQNGKDGLVRHQFNEFKSIKESVQDFLEQVDVEHMVTEAGGSYYMFHKDDKMGILVNFGGKAAKIYTFKESWSCIVESDRMFRMTMSKRLIEENDEENNVASVHDWIEGHLTSPADVPFSLSKFIEVWGHRAQFETIQPEPLIGYQVMKEDGEFPEGYFSFQIIRNFSDAQQLVKELGMEPPYSTEWKIFPVYRGDIEEPAFI